MASGKQAKKAELPKKAGKTSEKGDKDCVFCKIARRELPADIVYESANFMAFPDVRPRTEGHTIIITKKHYANIIEMPESLGSEMLEAIKKVFEIRAKQGAEGFNLIMNNFPVAGQIVMHAHIHLLPRRKEDNLNFGL